MDEISEAEQQAIREGDFGSVSVTSVSELCVLCG